MTSCPRFTSCSYSRRFSSLDLHDTLFIRSTGCRLLPQISGKLERRSCFHLQHACCFCQSPSGGDLPNGLRVRTAGAIAQLARGRPFLRVPPESRRSPLVESCCDLHPGVRLDLLHPGYDPCLSRCMHSANHDPNSIADVQPRLSNSLGRTVDTIYSLFSGQIYLKRRCMKPARLGVSILHSLLHSPTIRHHAGRFGSLISSLCKPHCRHIPHC